MVSFFCRASKAMVAVAWLCALAGCGRSDGLHKVIVTGKVSYDGQPIANGQIYFYPEAGTKGPVSGAPIKDGQYRAEAKEGVPVGSHRVRVEGYRPGRQDATGQPQGSDLLQGGAPQQFLPPKYNRQTQLQVVVPGDQPEFTYDVELAK